MKNGNYFCKINCPQQYRGAFFNKYRDVLSRSQEFNTTFVSLPNGIAIGVSYLTAHPKTDRIMYRYDILWNEEIERQLKSCGAEIEWDEDRILIVGPGPIQDDAEIIPTTDVTGAAKISNGQGHSMFKWGDACP